MRLTDLEEWRILQVIQPHLFKAVQHGIKETGVGASAPHALVQHEFLLYELQKLVISIPANRDIDQETTYQFKKEVVEVFESAYPVLLRILPDYPSILYIQNLLGLQARGGKSKPSPELLSLGDVESILPALTSFNKRIESIFWTRLRETTPATESPKLSSVALDGSKRALVDALLMSLERHMSCCKSRAQHHMLLQGAGQSWHAENKSLISLFISSCRDPTEWQEIECLPDGYAEHFPEASVSQNADLTRTRDVPRDEHKKGKLRPLQSLCQDITIAQCYNEVLHLLLLEGTLYKQPREYKRAKRRAMVEVKTLKELIEKQRFSPIRLGSLSATSFTIQEKRELSLNLGWCFLYLFDCPWISNGWSADTISLLLSATASSSSLEFETPPYIRCEPECASSENDNGDLDIIMNDSVFLALGKLLVEMELGRRITATECNRHGQPSLWLTLDKILSEDGMLSACDDYLKAIEGCLELHRSILDLTPEERAAESAKLIYDSIVANLEKDFEHYRKPDRKRKRSIYQPPVDLEPSTSAPSDVSAVQMVIPHKENIDIAGTGDFGDAPDAIFKASKGSGNKQRPSNQPTTATIIVAEQGSKRMSKRVRVAAGDFITGSRRVTRSSMRVISSRAATLLSAQSGLVQIFDDLEPNTAAVDARAVSLSQVFLAKMESFLDFYLPTASTSHKDSHAKLSQRVKVCIIDTGIDLTHPTLKAAKLMGKLGEMKSFKGDPRDLKDEIGHGTHVAELVLTLAPEAELCVAKVAVAKTMPREDTKLISEAIQWAVTQGADIISLSLGLDVLDSTLDSAINEAAAAGKIVIAAAGNDGNNKPRAYPGSNRNVLCIHASDGKGKDGGISPRAWDNDDNFMTLGTAIPLIWRNKEVVKFGTSFATAVAAAIAADALAIIPQMIPLTANLQSRLFSSDGMRLMFALLSVPSDNGYKYIAPWNLWDGSKSSIFIQELILDRLKH